MKVVFSWSVHESSFPQGSIMYLYISFRHFSIVIEDAGKLCWENGALILVVGMMTDNSGGS